MSQEFLERLANAIAEGETDDSVKFAQEAIDAGIPPFDVLNKGASKGMDIVNQRYNEGEAFLPELICAGDAMSGVVDLLFKAINESGGDVPKAGTVVIGQAKGDVHDIGKNIVAALLSVNGFEVHNIGIDVPVKAFIEKAEEVNADIIGMSTLLTTSLPYMEDALKYIEDSGNRDKYYYIVGGGPVTPEFAKRLPADGWARTAFDAVELCKKLMKKDKPGVEPTEIVDSETAI